MSSALLNFARTAPPMPRVCIHPRDKGNHEVWRSQIQHNDQKQITLHESNHNQRYPKG